jgi:hypothetical protein
MLSCDLDEALMWVNIASALIIVYRGVFQVANSMTKKTYFPVRAAWILMITGSMAVLAGPFFGFSVTSVQTTISFVGVAIFVFFERRFFRLTNG